MGFDSKCNFAPPTILLGLLLCPWTWGIFFGGIQHFPLNGCSAASCNFGVLTGEDESASFYSVILIPTEAVIKIAGRNVNKLRYADDTTLMAESKEELKSLFMKVKEESEKVGLKINIQKMKIMASGPIISWQIDEKTMETVTDFIWGTPKSLQMLTAAMKLKDVCSLKEKL